MSGDKRRPREIRRVRRRGRHACWDHLLIAPLWVAYSANLGTLLRSCDATGACLAVPATEHYRKALTVGDSRQIAHRCCIHWIDTGKDRWIREQRSEGWRIVAVELAEGAVALPRLPAAESRTVILLGHETLGIPSEHVAAADVTVEIPMVGSGGSLNVAVAGSLVLFKLAGLV